MSAVVVLENASLTDALTTALRRQIIGGTIIPGTRMSEAWVAERFAVARPTAKAGLDRLVNEGILRRGPRRSAVVPILSAKDIRDIYYSREPVESQAVIDLARKSLVPIEADNALAIMRAAADQSKHSVHTEADVALHRALVEATGSERLRRMHGTVIGETQLCIGQVRASADVDLHALTDLHALILEAIRCGDPDAAVSALRNDLHTCCDRLLRDISKGLHGDEATE